MPIHDLNFEVLDLVRAEAAKDGGRLIYNSFTSPTAPDILDLPQGLQFHDFDVIGRDMVLEVTPLTNRLPHRGPVGGNALFWREITSHNTGDQYPGVSEGQRGAVVERSTRDKVSKFAGFGYENVSTFESQYAARGVADPRELARLQAVKALRMQLERVNLYSNKTVQLGTPDQPTGSIEDLEDGEVSTVVNDEDYFCFVVALSGSGLQRTKVATTGVPQEVTRTNADNSTDTFGGGSSNKSIVSAAVTGVTNKKIRWTCPDVRGAVGYAWYIGEFPGTAGACRLMAVTTINQFEQLAGAPTTTQTAASITADFSTNELEYDGLMTILQDSGSNCYYRDNGCEPLTADNTGNIKQFIRAFYYFNKKFLISPNEIMVSPLEAYYITDILLSGPAAQIYQKMLNSSESVHGGFYVSAVLNPFTGDKVPIVVNPVQPDGFILFLTWDIPYPIEKLGKIWEIVMRQPTYVIEWPGRTRKHEVGVYVDQGLKCELTFAQGMIKNIKSPKLVPDAELEAEL